MKNKFTSKFSTEDERLSDDSSKPDSLSPGLVTTDDGGLVMVSSNIYIFNY